jgi:osmoprotectant transport system substrate-binding protein
MRRRAIIIGLLIVFVLATVAGCGDGGAGNGETRGPVTVGSKIDTEGGVLGQIIIAVLKDAGYEVADKTKTGTTDVVRKALTSGEIDIYPEYTGTALTQFFPDAKIAGGVSNDGQASFETVKELDAANGIVWLERAPANNTWAIAIPGALASANGIESLADWAAYINAGNPVKLVGSQEFVDRDDALPAFEKAYGFSLNADQLIILSGGDTAQTEAAAAQGTNGANAAMAYGTDGSIAALGLVVLSDPLGVQPVYEPAPSVRKAVLDTYPEIATLLDPVFKALTLETLQDLNGKVAVDGQDPKVVATEYLKSKGLIK